MRLPSFHYPERALFLKLFRSLSCKPLGLYVICLFLCSSNIAATAFSLIPRPDPHSLAPRSRAGRALKGNRSCVLSDLSALFLSHRYPTWQPWRTLSLLQRTQARPEEPSVLIIGGLGRRSPFPSILPTIPLRRAQATSIASLPNTSTRTPLPRSSTSSTNFSRNSCTSPQNSTPPVLYPSSSKPTPPATPPCPTSSTTPTNQANHGTTSSTSAARPRCPRPPSSTG